MAIFNSYVSLPEGIHTGIICIWGLCLGYVCRYVRSLEIRHFIDQSAPQKWHFWTENSCGACGNLPYLPWCPVGFRENAMAFLKKESFWNSSQKRAWGHDKILWKWVLWVDRTHPIAVGKILCLCCWRNMGKITWNGAQPRYKIMILLFCGSRRVGEQDILR